MREIKWNKEQKNQFLRKITLRALILCQMTYKNLLQTSTSLTYNNPRIILNSWVEKK